MKRFQNFIVTKALNFAASPAFHNYGNAQTLHTVVAEPSKQRFLIGIGGDASALDEDMVDIDFKLWVAGEDLPIKQLKGRLNLGRRASLGKRARHKRGSQVLMFACGAYRQAMASGAPPLRPRLQTSTCSDMASASSTSTPSYLTVLSILVCPSSSCTALGLPVRR